MFETDKQGCCGINKKKASSDKRRKENEGRKSLRKVWQRIWIPHLE
jgi:hypothetical protein